MKINNFKFQLDILIREWVAANYGESELENPSWDIDSLVEYITKGLETC